MNSSTNSQFFYLLALILITCISANCRKTSDNHPAPAIYPPVSTNSEVESWLTTPDKAFLFQKTSWTLNFGTTGNSYPVIEIDTTQQFQTIDGFGFTLTGGSAYLINQKLTATQREDLLKELFLTEKNGIGISYLRVSIGASDLDARVFSYDDLPAGQTDPELLQFSILPDKADLIPVLKQILKLNPDIKIFGSPWSAPVWMKSNGSTKGGSLKPEYYAAYARYFVRYIQEMAKEGIVIDAITPQNEPENPNNNPSLVMTAAEQADFIKNHLGSAFKSANIKTKIILFDHNCDHPDYPISILNDASAKPFIDGSAFHLYLGDITALSKTHDAHPDKNIYFTEQWTSSEGNFGGDLNWHVKNLIVGATRNWAKNVLEWNLAADPFNKPHTDGGCDKCLGALTIGESVSRNVSYYIIAHASKLVRPGSVRIASSLVPSLPNVAFMTPAGKKVLIVLNESNELKTFNIKYKGKTVNSSLQAGAVATYSW